ncbi:permuted papain-like amidase YaeF/Yiix C92 family enzyme [Hoeflea marina]|uniref:Permuted papain-like amidase YaeF/Yiix C92 family enzyme n=1 Tax=Hoeflea marina TaxID=274592 RepID=A0A317PIQ8_9HYPH|nr:lipo-like protein [Hoeflea marina]PWW00214.1 permuted papain-like amidase YaeF/Yiix C92 family enzyme [Hoeflea marina]
MTESAPSPDTWLDWLGRLLAGKLQAQTSGYEPYTPSDPETLGRTLQPGDILLVEGNSKISTAIKYLTQSTWSHAALFVGDTLDPAGAGGDNRPQLVEVDLGQGCIAVPLSKYTTYNTRICRPVGLAPQDRAAIVAFMTSKIGLRYDMKNILDLMRYFIPTPPVPVRWRRRMIGFGSGDPTRAICSTLIAQAFQSVGYPILPEIVPVPGQAAARSDYSRREIMQIRHHSLFTPRDFDLSPYFLVVKPTLEYGFDYKRIEWRAQNAAQAAGAD